jgi:putative sigma-54 modulation protein
MKLEINSVHFTADSSLLEHIQRKANKLDQFYDRIISGEVYLRLDKDTGDNHKKIVELKLHVPGNSLFVKEENGSFEGALEFALEAMKTQLKKLHDKQKDHSAPAPEVLFADVEAADATDEDI